MILKHRLNKRNNIIMVYFLNCLLAVSQTKQIYGANSEYDIETPSIKFPKKHSSVYIVHDEKEMGKSRRWKRDEHIEENLKNSELSNMKIRLNEICNIATNPYIVKENEEKMKVDKAKIRIINSYADNGKQNNNDQKRKNVYDETSNYTKEQVMLDLLKEIRGEINVLKEMESARQINDIRQDINKLRESYEKKIDVMQKVVDVLKENITNLQDELSDVKTHQEKQAVKKYGTSRIANVVYAINCGGASHTDSNGIFYAQDPYEGGAATFVEWTDITKVARVPSQDVYLYRTLRCCAPRIEYAIPIKEDGNYVMILKFTENTDKVDVRVQNIILNRIHTVATKLDLFKTVKRQVAYDIYVPFTLSGSSLEYYGKTSVVDANLVTIEIQQVTSSPVISAICVIKGTIDEIPKLPLLTV